jgi:hypothetical protein
MRKIQKFILRTCQQCDKGWDYWPRRRQKKRELRSKLIDDAPGKA